MTDEHQLREIKKHFDSTADRVQRKWTELFDEARKTAERDIVVSVEWLVEHQGKKLEAQWDSGFGELQWAVEELRDEVREGAERIEQTLTRGLAGIEAWLRRGVQALEHPRGVRALEFRREAEFARDQGWITEALKGFLAAEKLNYQDYKVHLNIGLLYRELGEPGKALEYFGKAAKYARPRSNRAAAAASGTPRGCARKEGTSLVLMRMRARPSGWIRMRSRSPTCTRGWPPAPAMWRRC